ncbi:MAG: DUF452 family protein [Rikenellaceae bacterium]
MKQELIHSAGRSKLLLIFSGWGGEPNLFATDFREFTCDVMVCYDYTDMVFDSTILSQYAEVELVAWSMGVFVAGQIFRETRPQNIAKTTAINGTPYPIDNRRGIAENTFRATLQGLENEATRNVSLVKFRRRMCGNSEVLKDFLAHNPQRLPQELALELGAIQSHIQSSVESNFEWDRAIIGTLDLIFLPENQRNAWRGVAREIIELQEPHYFSNLPYKYLSVNE